MNLKLTHKALLEVLPNTQGNISKIKRKLETQGINADWHTIEHALSNPLEHFAYYINCARNDIQKEKRENELKELHARYLDEQETMLDVAESGLMEAVINKEQWAIKYALSTKGKKRGYDTTPIIKIDDTEPLNIDFSGLSKTELEENPNVEIGGLDEESE